MDSKEQLPGYMERINRLKKRVLETRPEIDLENARLLPRPSNRRKESRWWSKSPGL